MITNASGRRVVRLDFTKIAPKLYQGGAVVPLHDYADFSMIVLCAVEYQPVMPYFGGQIIPAAFDDTLRPTGEDLARALNAALMVASELRRGGRVLVTCYQGLNRSGLVVGLTLSLLGTMHDGKHIVNTIRTARGSEALKNTTYERIVVDFADQRTRRVPSSSSEVTP